MAITLQDYLTSLQGKRVAVIGIGVSNTPLIKTLLQAGISVTACDKAPRTAFGALADELESMGAVLHLGMPIWMVSTRMSFSALREFVPIFHRFCPPWKREVR